MSSHYDIVVATAARDRKFVTIYGNFSTTVVDVRIELRAVNITIALSDVVAASLLRSSSDARRERFALCSGNGAPFAIKPVVTPTGAHKRNFDSCLCTVACVRSQ